MMVTVRRLVRGERVRLTIVSVAMCAWFLLIMAVTKSAMKDVQAKMDLFHGSSLMKGFGIGSLATPQLMLDQMIGVTFNHPIVLALLGSIFLVLGARSVQGELRDGTLEVTLARPISRTTYLLAYAVFIAASVVIVMAVAGASIFAFHGMLNVPGTTHVGRIIEMCANGALVYIAFGMLALLTSVVMARRGSAIGASVGIFVVMYATTFVARIWNTSAMRTLDKLSLFHWFDPAVSLSGAAVTPGSWIVPSAVAIGALALACWRLERRDL